MCDELTNVKDIVSKISGIYKIAQKEGFFPILPAGQILEIAEDGRTRIRFFLEVLNGQEKHPLVHILPAGTYSCMQSELYPGVDLVNAIRDNWKCDNRIRVIINNIALDKYSFETRPSELQRLEERWD